MFKTIDEFIRVLHGTVEYAWRVDLPFAWLQLYSYDLEDSFEPPRCKLADCMPRKNSSIVELWAMGMESVFDEGGKEVYLIAAECEGSGLCLRENDVSYTGYDAAETARWFEAALNGGTTVKTFSWGDTYLVRAAGLHSVEVKLLDLPYPERVYTCNLYEGEGWWAQMVFAVR